MKAAHLDRQPEPVKLPGSAAALAVELRHLRYFAALADAGSFTRAAERMFIAQPTLSQQIRRLEEIVGAPLLQRRRDGVRLTKAGAVLPDASRAVLSLVDQEVNRTRQAALVWSGDLPRTLQQILFDTAESITSPGPARQVEPELKAMSLSVTHLGQAAPGLRSLVPSRGWPLTDGYARTGSADYAAAAWRGELNDVNRCEPSGGRCRGGGLVSEARERRQQVGEAWTTWLVTRGQWRLFAACRSADPDLFFPISDSGPALEQTMAAKAICATCRVQRECLAFALRTGQVHGIWGGTTERERAAVRRRTVSEQPCKPISRA